MTKKRVKFLLTPSLERDLEGLSQGDITELQDVIKEWVAQRKHGSSGIKTPGKYAPKDFGVNAKVPHIKKGSPDNTHKDKVKSDSKQGIPDTSPDRVKDTGSKVAGGKRSHKSTVHKVRINGRVYYLYEHEHDQYIQGRKEGTLNTREERLKFVQQHSSAVIRNRSQALIDKSVPKFFAEILDDKSLLQEWFRITKDLTPAQVAQLSREIFSLFLEGLEYYYSVEYNEEDPDDQVKLREKFIRILEYAKRWVAQHVKRNPSQTAITAW